MQLLINFPEVEKKGDHYIKKLVDTWYKFYLDNAGEIIGFEIINN